MKTQNIMLLLFSLVSILSRFYLGKCETQPLAPALFVFGDSILDNGNNIYLPVFPLGGRNNYAPYGIDFTNSTPTGRATNGKTVSDFFADYLLLPEYPPPYMQPHNESISQFGYNYASAGCSILSATDNVGCLNLSRQVGLFETTVKTELNTFLEPAEIEEYLSNSIFFIWMGNNDYLVNYLTGSTKFSKMDPYQFADLLIESLSEKVQKLYSLGARKIVLFEIAPLGCMPMNRNEDTSCNELKSGNATIFNNKLSLMIQNLTSTLDNSYITHGKTNELTNDAITNPEKYGLKNVKHSCCNTILLRVPCWPSFGIFKPCEKRDEYLFWDGAHPTEIGHSTLASQCIYNSSVCTLMSIEQLVAVQVQPKLPSLHSSA